MAIVAMRDPFPSDSSLLRELGDATPAQRIAGAMLVVNALLSFISIDLVPAAAKSAAFMGPGSVVSGILDVVIGALLVLNYGRLAPWALVRVVLGLVVYTLIHVSAGVMVSACAQVGISGALLLLLIGRAGVLRLTLGCVLFSLYLLFAVLGLSVMAAGKNPIGGVVLVAVDDAAAGERARDRHDAAEAVMLGALGRARVRRLGV